jgi:glycosyltransferase involved in cell wall biosynthesis
MKKVSVIIPTYNRSHMLSGAIDSVLAQTYQNIEAIIVDDASVDNTAEIVNGHHDARIRYIRHSENHGVAAALNTGIARSSGDLIAFLGDDDKYLPRKIERQMRVFLDSAPSVGVVYCGCYFVNDFNGERLIYEPRGRHLGKFYVRDFTAATCLVRKDCFTSAGLFDERLKCLVDFDLTLRLSEFYDFGFCKEPLYEVHIHKQGRVSGDSKRNIEALDIIYNKLADRISMLPKASRKKAFSLYHQERGDYFYDSGMTREGRNEFWASLSLYPLNLRTWIFFLASLMGPRLRPILQTIPSAIGRMGVMS